MATTDLPHNPAALGAAAAGQPAAAAEAHWQRLLGYAQADPHKASLLAELVDVALQQGRAAEALAWAQRECALPDAPEPAKTAAHYRQAVALLFNGQAQASAAALRALLAQGLEGVGPRRSLAQACSHLHD
ncbi:MAG: hypothetical protein C4K60_11850 [Ideonella sp. MAG2]|nr:MAG: hypothetical protein C4K60_11850 [Ideonella sp. MAG2]